MKNNIGKIGVVGTILVSGLLCQFGTGVKAKELIQTRNDTESNMYHQPINILKTASNIKTQSFSTTADDWEDAGTTYGDTKFDKYSTAAVVQTLGFALNLPTGGWSSYLAGLANMVILGEYKIVYFKDKQEFKMAGATLMTKHHVTIYEDKDRKKKIGSDSFIITDKGGPKVADV
ncbi:hypothetical protein MOE47_09360 [Bacillus atrophaeus]|uniref:hypothetical protein n=1 Tax=Bacillus atrophaeus TaxID=1452 RepID=UPI00227E87F4|nr:hypothetical protein [Bacillus atrophaeus]MCY8914298.1 hypothetical protein [Bacillus atrophaeus]MCY9114624.1 hypothetical protein [Bacillus atrophaeus]MEC0924121.1 hypothetical protein [Bacillus atrophaeus]MEC0932731.1 hypothetical protein [Bacillus atrophaeus]